MKSKKKIQNIFGSTRIKLDLIAAVFILILLLLLSVAIYRLLTIDIIYQTTGEFSNLVDEDVLFQNFKDQTIFLLALSDTIIFVISMLLFDRLVQNLLSPIEYLSNVQKRFAENVSHELRTPLSIMSLENEIIINKIKNNKIETSFLLESINNVQREIRGITDLIDDLLFEARIKYQEEKLESIDISTLISIINKTVKNLENLKTENVEVLISDNLEKIDYDSFFKINTLHLERILNNIISNSLKFTNSGFVKINLNIVSKDKKKHLSISVEDSGFGIKKSELQKIGQRFFRGSNVETEISGTGIGLAIVKDLCNMYGIDFEIKSQEGVGTNVYLSNIELSDMI